MEIDILVLVSASFEASASTNLSEPLTKIQESGAKIIMANAVLGDMKSLLQAAMKKGDSTFRHCVIKKLWLFGWFSQTNTGILGPQSGFTWILSDGGGSIWYNFNVHHWLVKFMKSKGLFW